MSVFQLSTTLPSTGYYLCSIAVLALVFVSFCSAERVLAYYLNAVVNDRLRQLEDYLLTALRLLEQGYPPPPRLVKIIGESRRVLTYLSNQLLSGIPVYTDLPGTMANGTG